MAKMRLFGILIGSTLGNRQRVDWLFLVLRVFIGIEQALIQDCTSAGVRPVAGFQHSSGCDEAVVCSAEARNQDARI
jgi:hypothetical protein